MSTGRKLKFTEKLSYGLADFPEAANSILAAFLTMFYTDNIGLAAGAVGTMFFISKLFDGISDILAGTLIDKTKTKWGKARPWLLWLAVPTGLALALIFFIPQDGSKTMQMVYAFVTYNLFTAVMFTITGIARSALLALMTQDMQERGSMASFGMFFGLGGTILGCSVTFPLVFKLGGDVMAWRILFIIYGVIVMAGLFAGFFLSKEYVTSVESVTQTEESKTSFREGVKLFFTNKYLILALIMTVLVNFVTQVNSSSQTYFYTYTMGDPMLTTTLNLVSVVPILAGIVVLVGPCLAKFGKRNCMYIGIWGQLVGSVIRGIAGMTQSVPLLIVGTIVSGAVTGLLAVPVSTLFADGIDYGEYKTNKRIEGMGSAITSFSQKISSGLALASVGWILSMTGYVQNAVQSAATNMGIITLYSWLPAILLLVIFFILKFCYHYDKEAATVIAELESRKAKNRKNK
ncbi:MAG: glycoside-pentoside-hexuronide (GPH):cation symporter [Eubacteriales bacterium]|nr:glycoside-pentoside-hexuronide (GPH):cation symporter [Eubacteriales bacterium]